MSCTSCATPVPDGARFCPACGHPVGSRQAEERRIVTVLFADLVGFTTLAEHLDPEQTKRFIDSCFERLLDDVNAFGGRVDKILGDGILALFGAPIAHEDDPERAVRAALRMQRTLADYVSTSRLTGIDGIRMRIGINTGEVLVGTLAGTDYTAMGDVVNTASRLQCEAPPGRVLVGETTYALSAHTFEYESMGELVPRGREQSVKAWLAGAATAPPGAGRRRRRDVPLVGRNPEVAMGTAAFDLVAEGRGVLLAVCGESGVGKSRLVDELLHQVRTNNDAMVLEGACVPYGEANVWWPIATALATWFGLDPHPTAEVVRELAREQAPKIVPGADAAALDRMVEVLAHLFGHPSTLDRLDAANSRHTIHRAVTKVLEVRAHTRPTVLSIDDLHWADPKLTDLLAHLVHALGRHPFALVTAMRPDPDVVWPPRSDRASVIAITLAPLSRESTERLAVELLPGTVPDQRMLNALYERSGGNPLFLQELAALAAVADPGALELDLPDSLRTLVGARLNQLTTEQRQVLDNAATLGTSGSFAHLERFALETGQVFDPATVMQLDDLGLLDVHGRRWEFRSDSVREAVYQTLTKASRAVRHAGVAKAMRNTSPAGLDDLAHHAATSAELVQELGQVEGVPATITVDAIRLLTAAAERAHETGRLHLAVRHSTRALDLMEPVVANHEPRALLRLARAGALADLRQVAPAHADLEAVLAYAAEASDRVAEGEARRLLGTLSQAEGKLDAARTELGRSVDLLRSVNRPDLLARALRARGFIELFGGSLIDAEWFFGEGDALYRGLDDRRGMAWIEQHRAWIAFLSGDLAAARLRLHNAADTLEELGDRNGVGWAFGLLAFVEFFQRNFAEAEALARMVTAEADERGDEWAKAMMQTLLTDVRLWSGHIEEAMGLADAARTTFRRLNDRYGLGQALAPLVRSQVALGRTAAAQRSTEELQALADTAPLGPGPLLAVAGAAMHRGDGAAAVTAATRAIDDMRALGSTSFEPLVILAVGLAQCDRLEEALATLDRVRSPGIDHPFTRSVSALLHTLARNPTRAIADAETVANTAGASYLDQVFAYIAAAGAYLQLGDAPRAALAADAAAARATNVGDQVAMALARGCHLHVTGTAHADDAERPQLGAGWAHVLSGLG